jgi:thymidine phosphorylase
MQDAPIKLAVPAQRSGVITQMDARAIGMALVVLGGARTRSQDEIDHATGLTDIAPIGTHLSAGDPLAMIHARDEVSADEALRRLTDAVIIGDKASQPHALIKARLS